jgi:hypothetical protein
MGNMLRATAPGLAGFTYDPIPDDELWPELEPGDFDVGDLALDEAGIDEDPSLTIAELYELLWQEGLLVPLEQCCDAGVLLPPELREARLRRLPADLGARLEAAMRHLAPEVLAPFAMHAYWTLRCCRARRTGSPDLRHLCAPAGTRKRQTKGPTIRDR